MRGVRDIFVPGGNNGGAGGGVALSADASNVSSGTVVFSNSNGVSFGLSGSTITASITPAGGAQTAISGIIVSDATYSSGTVSFSNAGNITIQSSVNGATQYIKLSGNAPQTNQSAIKGFGVSNTGQTAGNTGISTGIDWVLAGSNSITLSQSTAAGGPNTVWVQHPSWLTTAMASNRGSDFVQATAAFAGTSASGTIASNGISVSIGPYITTADLSQNSSKYIQNWKLSGNTAGTTSSAQGTDLWLAGGNGVTLSGSSNTISFSVATNYQSQGAYLTTADLSQNSSKYVQNWKLTGNTAGTTSSAEGTDLWFSGGNNVTLSGSSNTIVVSVPSQTNQSAIKGLGASNTGNTAGNTGLSTGIDWVLAGSNNITISQSTVGGGPNTLWVSGPTVGGAQTGISGIIVSDATYTSGTVSFSNAGNITIQSSVNGATQYIKLSGNAAQTTQSAIKGFGVSNTGATAGNTGLSTGIDWVLAGSSLITLSQSTAAGGPNTVWIQHPAWLTTADLSANSSKYVQNWKLTGNTSGTTSSAQGTDLWFSGGNNITISGSSNSILISAFNQTNQSAIKGLGASNTGNTAGNTGLSTGIDWVIAGSQAITVSESTTAGGPNTLWINAPNAAAGNVTFSAGGNSAGLASVVFSNSNGVSFGLNGSTITASVNAGGGGGIGGGVSTGGNTAGSTGTVTTGNIVFVGSGPISLSQSTGAAGSNATISILGPATSSIVGSYGLAISTNGSTLSVSATPVSEWMFDASPIASSANVLLGVSSLYFVPFDIYWPISASRINFFISVATSTNTQNSTGSASNGFGYALYTRMGGTGTDRISQLTSYSAVLVSMSFSSNTQFNATHYAGLSNATSHTTASTGLTTSNASTYLLNSLGGYRVLALPLNSVLTPGRYWLGYSYQSTTANQTNMSVNVSLNGYTYAVTAYRPFGTSSAASNASVYGPMPGIGTYSAVSAGWPASIGITASDIKMPASVTVPKFNISGIGTSSNIL